MSWSFLPHSFFFHLHYHHLTPPPLPRVYHLFMFTLLTITSHSSQTIYLYYSRSPSHKRRPHSFEQCLIVHPHPFPRKIGQRCHPFPGSVMLPPLFFTPRLRTDRVLRCTIAVMFEQCRKRSCWLTCEQLTYVLARVNMKRCALLGWCRPDALCSEWPLPCWSLFNQFWQVAPNRNRYLFWLPSRSNCLQGRKLPFQNRMKCFADLIQF